MPSGVATPEGLCLSVEIAEGSTGFDARGAANGIDPHAAHQREVEQETSLAYGIPGNVVSPCPHRKQSTVLTCKRYGAHDVGGASAADHCAGLAVDHRIPDRAGLIVACFTREANLASQRFAENG
ncbi:hypothetical protein ACVILL_001875 [Bradyrhizobium sp. USDA 3364]